MGLRIQAKRASCARLREVGSGWWSGYWGGWGQRYGGMTQNVVQSAGAAGAPEGPTSPGQIAVTGRVPVTFELAP